MYRRLQHKFATEREFAAFSGFLRTGSHTLKDTGTGRETNTGTGTTHTLWIETRSAHAGALTCLSECLSKTDTTDPTTPPQRVLCRNFSAFVLLAVCMCMCVLVFVCVWVTLRGALATSTPAAMFCRRAVQSKQSNDSHMRNEAERARKQRERERVSDCESEDWRLVGSFVCTAC